MHEIKFLSARNSHESLKLLINKINHFFRNFLCSYFENLLLLHHVTLRIQGKKIISLNCITAFVTD